jgi:hypothetical protein
MGSLAAFALLLFAPGIVNSGVQTEHLRENITTVSQKNTPAPADRSLFHRALHAAI